LLSGWAAAGSRC